MSSPSRTSRRSAGLTLVEMMVGVAVLGVVVAAAIPSLTGLMERRRITAAASEIASIFNQARAESLAASERITVHMEDVPATVGQFSCIRLSTHGGIDRCKCNLPEASVCATGYSKQLRSYILPHSSSVRFSSQADKWNTLSQTVIYASGLLQDNVSNVRVNIVGDRTGAKLRVETNPVGRVHICSPDASMSGYPKCE
ncbi:pilus assembly FimT family protein [Roseateles cellulosilyticus]|uniref:Prepilin-type N-terminal cleavage/methylation domain-containing protein n=1 Tax=Pelomonas cellulosilytica TaxID=2906762 RepID=A0ABS8XT17_9BURK|nr:prepilin-type N-terminal cleavage/methylation domain-containing protein [Pelomonas sp. P8]MCE4555842.1 prepilin-type N-terminal cleavage/methylation domain-containing protein [Pelomonas sp. P8]